VSLTEAMQRGYIRFHRAVYERTGGLLGHRLAGNTTLILRTTGRTSGLPRTAVLAYARDGPGFAVVASNNGLEQPPAWLLNIRANPAVELQVARRKVRGTARAVEPTDVDYPRLWQLVNDHNRNRYEAYRTRTRRPIPIVVVTPAT
jgi:F420H(2)-dependent quinone reductase